MRKIILSLVVITVVGVVLVHFNAPKEPTLWAEYVVRSGDTVCSIAIEATPNSKDYRKTEYYITKKNNIENAIIHQGQTILVPVCE